MLRALEKIESLGAQVTYNARLMSLPEIIKKYKTVTMREIRSKLLRFLQPLDLQIIDPIPGHQLAFVISRFLGLFNNPQLRTLQDQVRFNKEHAAEELPPGMPCSKFMFLNYSLYSTVQSNPVSKCWKMT
jgi:amidase